MTLSVHSGFTALAPTGHRAHPGGRRRCTAGRLSYDGVEKLEIDDRALAHLQLVISSKLRRGESFLFTWRPDTSLGGGRVSVWMHPHASLVFRFAGSRPPRINRAWAEAMMNAANSPAGLSLVPEPPEPTPGATSGESSL